MSSLIWTNHQRILKNLQIGFFKRIFLLFNGSDGWCKDETYEADVRAVVEQ